MERRFVEMKVYEGDMEAPGSQGVPQIRLNISLVPMDDHRGLCYLLFGKKTLLNFGNQ